MQTQQDSHSLNAAPIPPAPVVAAAAVATQQASAADKPNPANGIRIIVDDEWW